MFRTCVLAVSAVLLLSNVQAAIIAKPADSIIISNPTPTPTKTPFRGADGGRIHDLAADVSPSPSPVPNANGALCDVFDQDCPSGYKCIPESLSGRPRCRRLDENPDHIGDECSTKSDNDGDSCDIDGICVHGICRELCRSSKHSPQCEGLQHVCHFYGHGVGLCEKPCDPLLHNVCKHMHILKSFCTMDSSSPNQQFTCMPEPNSGLLGMFGQSCTVSSQCRQGSVCMVKTTLPNGFCHDSATLDCCTPLAEDPNDCPSGMVLQPFYEVSPPGLENLGVCVL